jgi:hypothetical protein
VKAATQPDFATPSIDDYYQAVPVDLMMSAWRSFNNGLQSPAPSEERRYQRADSRVRYAVRDDRRNQWNYVARCYAFGRLIREIGLEGFGEWLQPSDPGYMMFHDAVWEVVAAVPLRRRDGRFERIEFLAAVERIAKIKPKRE